MKLEIHVLQNFAPSNLNRDDTGSPKDCELGGVRRSRISSQCFKRAIRNAFVEHDLLSEGERSARTKRLIDEVAGRVSSLDKNIPEDKARVGAIKALEAGGLKTDDETSKTQYLLFMPVRSLDALAQVVVDNIDVLAAEPATKSEDDKDKKGKPKSAKAAKSDAKHAANPEVKKAVERILSDAARSPEIALFGRMIADRPDWNIDAACQVAHAVSTNRVAVEFDFYTAIDDLKKNDTAGSDMMGTIPFNSACFYRYLVVDIGDLVKNLGGDDQAVAQAKRTIESFVRAAVLAIPSGKQNSMAAQNPPSLVLCDVRDKAEPRSLANAFVEPVRPGREGDLVTLSTLRLAKYAASLDKVYGTKGRGKDGLSFVSLDPEDTVSKDIERALPAAVQRKSLDDLIQGVTRAAFGDHA
jgi:CRISPR system Cascade subunit CasC